MGRLQDRRDTGGVLAGVRSRVCATVRVRVLVPVSLVDMCVWQSLVVLGAVFVARWMRVWVTVHEVAVNVRVLVDQVHAEQ